MSSHEVSELRLVVDLSAVQEWAESKDEFGFDSTDDVADALADDYQLDDWEVTDSGIDSWGEAYVEVQATVSVRKTFDLADAIHDYLVDEYETDLPSDFSADLCQYERTITTNGGTATIHYVAPALHRERVADADFKRLASQKKDTDLAGLHQLKREASQTMQDHIGAINALAVGSPPSDLRTALLDTANTMSEHWQKLFEPPVDSNGETVAS